MTTYIAIEGAPSCGKTTVANRIKSRMERLGKNVLLVKFPTDNGVDTQVSTNSIGAGQLPDPKLTISMFMVDIRSRINRLRQQLSNTTHYDLVLFDTFKLTGLSYFAPTEELLSFFYTLGAHLLKNINVDATILLQQALRPTASNAGKATNVTPLMGDRSKRIINNQVYHDLPVASQIYQEYDHSDFQYVAADNLLQDIVNEVEVKIITIMNNKDRSKQNTKIMEKSPTCSPGRVIDW